MSMHYKSALCVCLLVSLSSARCMIMKRIRRPPSIVLGLDGCRVALTLSSLTTLHCILLCWSIYLIGIIIIIIIIRLNGYWLTLSEITTELHSFAQQLIGQRTLPFHFFKMAMHKSYIHISNSCWLVCLLAHIMIMYLLPSFLLQRGNEIVHNIFRIVCSINNSNLFLFRSSADDHVVFTIKWSYCAFIIFHWVVLWSTINRDSGMV